jgi:hypothetical protein
MELDEMIRCFYAKEYAEYDKKGERLDSYKIDGMSLTLRHHSVHGKEFVTEYTLWDVMATLFAPSNAQQQVQADSDKPPERD